MDETKELKLLEFDGTTNVLKQLVMEGNIVWHIGFFGLEIAAKRFISRLTNGSYRGKPAECNVWADGKQIALAPLKKKKKSVPVAGENGETYLDVTLTHPMLWPDHKDVDEKSFRLLSLATDDGMPSHFFEWLKIQLDIPLKPEWAEWLWADGLTGKGFCTTINKAGTAITYQHREPIKKIQGMGCNVYRIHTDIEYQEVWLENWRKHFNLQPETLVLQRGGELVSESYTVKQVGKVYQFFENANLDKSLFEADNFALLYIKARQEWGYNISYTADAPKDPFEEWCEGKKLNAATKNILFMMKGIIDSGRRFTPYENTQYNKIFKPVDLAFYIRELQRLPKLA